MTQNSDISFEFSVVMAVYNVEPFLREAVDSLIAQDIGFKNIQLIMVDDGSTDGSGAICDEYAEKYPDNVVVVHKENGGVSSARNAGLEYIQGKYVNFLDADDKLSHNAMREVSRFFAAHDGETDVVSVPMMFFDGQTGEHTLNDKYNKGNRVIDLLSEVDAAQLSMASTFVTMDSLKGKRFCEQLSFAEDAQLLMQILIEKCTLGVINTTQYQYRRRMGGEQSAIQGSKSNPAWYMMYLRFFCQKTIQYCIARTRNLPRFVQYVLMYDLQWRLRQSKLLSDGILGASPEEYKETIYAIISHIDDDIILSQKNINLEYKLFALGKKHRKQPEQRITGKDISLNYGDTEACRLSECALCLEFAEFSESKLEIEGAASLPPLGFQEVCVEADVNSTRVQCEQVMRHEHGTSMDEVVLDYYGFRFSVPLDRSEQGYQIRFFTIVDGTRIENQNLEYGKFFPICNTYLSSYFKYKKWKLTQRNNYLEIVPCGWMGKARSELAFLKELWKGNQEGARKAVFARVAYYALRVLKRKPIWLISDRTMKAGDNGEALFRFLRKEHPKIKAYYVISKDCDSFWQMKKIGPTVDAYSIQHKLMHMLADLNISSAGDDNKVNPFAGYHDSYRDLLQQVSFVFLQHGITGNDISGWLNIYNKNISGFVTAAKPEYDSIIDGHYYYTEKQVWLTGFPRFDRLYNESKRAITISPTWREYLMGTANINGIWSLGKTFVESSYFRFYNELLNSERLLSAAKQYEYQIRFFPHPNIQPHIKVFNRNEQVVFMGMDTEYRNVYAESDLMITDYSSAVFDFAYLRKPLIYCQFDREEFFSGTHVCTTGYFNYERDGFGEVEYDLEHTIDRIIEYMENGCQLKDKYRERIDKFFAFNDKNNCQRVYERIMELEREKAK